MPSGDLVRPLTASNSSVTAWDADRVFVDEQRVVALAASLRTQADRTMSAPIAWDDDRFWLTSATAAERSQFMSIGNALNFRFWTKTKTGVRPAGGTVDGEYLVGSMYLWRRLRIILERNEFPLLEAEALAGITSSKLRRLLADDEGRDPLTPGFGDRVENLRNLGRVLTTVWDGSFYNLVQDAGEDLERFYVSSASMRAYDDPVRKLSTVNAIMHSGSGLTRFAQSIPPAIDYHVAKQLLRIGAVRVDAALEKSLAHQDFLQSADGLSIRRACLAALNEACLLAELPGDLVDNMLWSNRTICTEPVPQCAHCSFRPACEQRIEIQRPLELTRYY